MGFTIYEIIFFSISLAIAIFCSLSILYYLLRLRNKEYYLKNNNLKEYKKAILILSIVSSILILIIYIPIFIYIIIKLYRIIGLDNNRQMITQIVMLLISLQLCPILIISMPIKWLVLKKFYATK